MRLGELLCEKLEHANARPLLERLTAVPAHALRAHFLLADAAERGGDEAEARRQLEKIIAVDVDYPQARSRADRLRRTVPPVAAPPVAAATIAGLPDGGADFGRWRLAREIGRGASGAVYVAHDDELDRDVAAQDPPSARAQPRIAASARLARGARRRRDPPPRRRRRLRPRRGAPARGHGAVHRRAAGGAPPARAVTAGRSSARPSSRCARRFRRVRPCESCCSARAWRPTCCCESNGHLPPASRRPVRPGHHLDDGGVVRAVLDRLPRAAGCSTSASAPASALLASGALLRQKDSASTGIDIDRGRTSHRCRAAVAGRRRGARRAAARVGLRPPRRPVRLRSYFSGSFMLLPDLGAALRHVARRCSRRRPHLFHADVRAPRARAARGREAAAALATTIDFGRVSYESRFAGARRRRHHARRVGGAGRRRSPVLAVVVARRGEAQP